MLRSALTLSLVASALAAGPLALPAQAASACSLWAHVVDPDRRGTNVRAAASSKSRIVARLRKSGRSFPVVRITGQSGAWFRISKAEGAGRTVFQGRGYIHRSLLRVQLRGGAPMYAGPSRKRKLPYHAGDAEADGKLLACNGGWVRVYHTELKKRGWLHRNDHCPDMGTTCS